MCLYLKHVFLVHWRNLLKQPFKVCSRRRNGSLCGISIFSLCSGHLIHPPYAAPPHLHSVPLPASQTLAGTAERDQCHQLYWARRWLWEAVTKISNSSIRKMTWVWGNRSSYLPSKLLWVRDIDTCASPSPCMSMPTLGGDKKAVRAALASFFPWISTTVFPLTRALVSAAV